MNESIKILSLSTFFHGDHYSRHIARKARRKEDRLGGVETHVVQEDFTIYLELFALRL